MSDTEEFDYQNYMRKNLPDPTQIRRGPGPRSKRREAAKEQITIRIDQDILEQFKQLVPNGQGYQSLINQALRDWLAAQGVKELIREELAKVTNKMLSALRKPHESNTN